MDENIWKAAMDVVDQLEEALRPVGLAVRRLNPEESEGIPTVEITRREQVDGIGMICSVVFAGFSGVDVTYIQLYMTLTALAPEDRREELERFVEGANKRFMLGSLLTFEGGLCMRYILALDPDVPLEPAHLQTAVTAFIHQAAVCAKLGRAVCGGKMTADAALAHRE